MIGFKEYIIEASAAGKNTHMTHLQDLVIYGGVNGAREAINALRAMRDMLAGNAKKGSDLSVKFDGCFHEDTIVITDKGNLTIKEVVERTRTGEKFVALGMVNDEDCLSEIVAGNAGIGSKGWVKLYLEDGTEVILTEDHEVHTINRGWVQAKDLTEEDEISEIN